MTLDVVWATQWMLFTREVVATNCEYLIDLDRQIGDGDHGENSDRGFSQVVSILEEGPRGNVQDVLKVVAKTLMPTAGGAAGPLYGTAFLRAAKVCAFEPVNAEGVAALVLAALEGIQVRDKAEREEKTMVDTWGPASDTAAKVASEGVDEIAVPEAAAAAAAEGVAVAEPMKATKGHVSHLGERSIGHLDPGTMSSSIISAKALEAAKKA